VLIKVLAGLIDVFIPNIGANSTNMIKSQNRIIKSYVSFNGKPEESGSGSGSGSGVRGKGSTILYGI
jgi:hypothetical protein